MRLDRGLVFFHVVLQGTATRLHRAPRARAARPAARPAARQAARPLPATRRRRQRPRGAAACRRADADGCGTARCCRQRPLRGGRRRRPRGAAPSPQRVDVRRLRPGAGPRGKGRRRLGDAGKLHELCLCTPVRTHGRPVRHLAIEVKASSCGCLCRSCRSHRVCFSRRGRSGLGCRSLGMHRGQCRGHFLLLLLASGHLRRQSLGVGSPLHRRTHPTAILLHLPAARTGLDRVTPTTHGAEGVVDMTGGFHLHLPHSMDLVEMHSVPLHGGLVRSHMLLQRSTALVHVALTHHAWCGRHRLAARSSVAGAIATQGRNVAKSFILLLRPLSPSLLLLAPLFADLLHELAVLLEDLEVVQHIILQPAVATAERRLARFAVDPMTTSPRAAGCRGRGWPTASRGRRPSASSGPAAGDGRHRALPMARARARRG
mmetsp:Transcript_111769/g.301492  ORF Transcript_111769/g.301492 Transcript_111769/m.301492 type:complete len:431 (-) Transcript_111769:38-1330(-)